MYQKDVWNLRLTRFNPCVRDCWNLTEDLGDIGPLNIRLLLEGVKWALSSKNFGMRFFYFWNIFWIYCKGIVYLMHPFYRLYPCISSWVKFLDFVQLINYLVDTPRKYRFSSEHKGNNKAIMLFLCYTQLNPALYLLPNEKRYFISLKMLDIGIEN